jgi:branched-chain amino acid aminotransferase
MLATRLAQEAGFDEALLVTPHGRVLEGPTWSFFWAEGGSLYTPPLGERILSSITRAALIDTLGIEERVCTKDDDLPRAEEALLASSAREVVPIVLLDDQELPADGPLVAHARTALRERIAQELALFDEEDL